MSVHHCHPLWSQLSRRRIPRLYSTCPQVGQPSSSEVRMLCLHAPSTWLQLLSIVGRTRPCRRFQNRLPSVLCRRTPPMQSPFQVYGTQHATSPLPCFRLYILNSTIHHSRSSAWKNSLFHSSWRQVHCSPVLCCSTRTHMALCPQSRQQAQAGL